MALWLMSELLLDEIYVRWFTILEGIKESDNKLIYE